MIKFLYINFLFFFSTQLLFCAAPALIPIPQKINIVGDVVVLSANSSITFNHQILKDVANILANEILLLTQVRLPTASGSAVKKNTIFLSLTSTANLPPHGYRVTISQNGISVEGSGLQEVSFGCVTLLQALRVQNNNVVFPKLVIEDFPTEQFRGVLLDIAREPYSLDAIKRQIVLNRFYKIPYLVLHLSDDQSITFKLAFDPALGSQNSLGQKDKRLIPSYNAQQLAELVNFAKVRGITLIPEIEMPGHGAAFIKARPDLFKTGEYHHATLNIANPAAVAELKTIVKELAAIFSTSPYIHLGGDEADFAMLHRGITGIYVDPFGNKLIKVYDNVRKQWDDKLDILTTQERAAGRIASNVVLNDAHTVYRDFLNEMSRFVKSLGKQAIVWESPTARDSIVPLDRDIVIMQYEQFVPAYYYINSGFTLINASWSPLYIVHATIADGSDALKDTPEHIYAWNKRMFDVYYGNQTPTSKVTVTAEQAKNVLGAQLTIWESTESGFLAAQRPLIAAFAEKLWNPNTNRSYPDFAIRYDTVNRLVDYVLAANVAPNVKTSYKSINGQDYTMQVFAGTNIALLIPEDKVSQYDPFVIQAMVNTFDKAYLFYVLATGSKPRLLKNFNGLLTIAVVDATCGAGCGYLGATGIETDSMWNIIYNTFAQTGTYDQLPFYELGRNFWLYGNKLNGGAPDKPSVGQYSFTTGYAIYMRFKSMEYARIKGAKFGGQPFSDFQKSIQGLVDIYEQRPEFTFENTILQGKSVGSGSASDLFASFLMRLERDYGGLQFTLNIWKNVALQPDATTDQQAIDNFFIAACKTATRNLTNLFVSKWRWPISEQAQTKANAWPI